MAQDTLGTKNGSWYVEKTIGQSGDFTTTFYTTNKFLDKNIVMKTNVPAATGYNFSLEDKNISIGDPGSTGKYALSATLKGHNTFTTYGWVASELSAEASVSLGELTQSTLALNSGTPSTGSSLSINPSVANDQSLVIGAGYYGSARTITIKSMSTGAQAAATIGLSGQATSPTLAPAASTQDIANKVKLSLTPGTSSAVNTYYIALEAKAPASNITVNKNITTVGYLSDDDQISVSGSISENSSIYYIPVTSGAITLKATGTAAMNDSQTNATLTDSATSGIAIQATATATPAVNAFTAGWINSKPADGSSTTLTSVTKYLSALTIAAGKTLSSITNNGTLTTYSGSGAITTYSNTGIVGTMTGSRTISNLGKSGTNGAITITTNTYGTVNVWNAGSDKGVKVVGHTVTVDGTVVTNSAGDLTTTSLTQGTSTLSADNATVTRGVLSVGTGWINSSTIQAATFTNMASSGVTYVDISATPAAPILISGDYLYINKGYTDNLKISLARLIPEGSGDITISNTSDAIRTGYAFLNAEGGVVTGTLANYEGIYEISVGS